VTRGLLGRVASLALVFALGTPGALLAESKQAEGKRSAPAVDATTGKRLNEALAHLEAGRNAEAKAALAKLNLDRLSPYERSRVEQILAAVAHAQDDTASARKHLGQALASGGLNEQETSAVRFQLAQLYMAEEKWHEGAEALEQWFATTTSPNSAAYYLLAAAYYQLGNTQQALAPAQKAIDLAEKPQESWLQLLLALRLAREEYPQAVPLLMKLLAASPQKKSYWLQLSSVHGTLERYEPALVPIQLAYHAGMLTEPSELQRLADLLLQVGIPYRAAQILSQALEQKQVEADAKTWEKLGNCWIAAREYDKAIQPLGRAALLASGGELYVRLAEVEIQREEWERAAEALRRGLEKGGLRNPGSAQLLLGIAFYNQKKPEEARSWFRRASQHGSSRTQAEGWLRHVERELGSRPDA
jgi:tetratricopeptide (TPR) repeat protein